MLVPHMQLDRMVILLRGGSILGFPSHGQSWACSTRAFPQALVSTAKELPSSTSPVFAHSTILIFRQKIAENLEKKVFKNFGICS